MRLFVLQLLLMFVKGVGCFGRVGGEVTLIAIAADVCAGRGVVGVGGELTLVVPDKRFKASAHA